MRTRTFLRLFTVTALAAAILLASAGLALAAPGEPTLGLAELQAKLDASPTGTLPGYLKTVLKGSMIETIPVEVLSLTGDSAASSLILFEAQGAKIEKFGGIVSGMSGSPIYIEDGGVDKVIGALSYGDAFTLSGTGLATPIESMLQLLTDYAPQMQDLSAPVLTSGRIIDSVIVSSHPQSLKSASQGGAFVAKPLSSMFIGGIRPTNRLYKNLKKRLERRGVSVVQIDTGLSASASSFETTLIPGAAVAALAARGDMWLGGLGTVTYTDDESLLAFGHPMSFLGETSLFMANAVVGGVWPSSYAPYKIGYPATLKGEFTQDRNAGIFGTVGEPPAETPVRAHAVGNGREATSAVYLSTRLLDNGEVAGEVSYAASIAGYKLFDAYSTPGSAVTTTTVVVSEGEDEYVVTITNVVDDAYDIPSSIAYDVDNSIYSLLSVLEEGVGDPHIVSVDLESEISTQRRSARIVSLMPEAALKVGDNHIDVQVLAYGAVGIQTIETTLTIPEGTPLTGTLYASSVMSGDDSEMVDSFLGGLDLPIDDSYGRQTIPQIVTDLNGTVPNDTLFVTFEPDPSMLDGEDLPPFDTPVAIETSTTAEWVLADSAELLAPALTVETYPAPVSFGGYAEIYGEVVGPEKDTTVTVYATPYGGEEELVDTVLATYDEEMDELVYDSSIEDLETNTTIRVHVDGTKDFAPADATTEIKVRALVFVKSSSKSVRYGKTVTLTASVLQGTAAGTVSFQYYDTRTRKWKAIGRTKTLVASSPGYSRATTSWKVLRGTHKVRVLFNGSPANTVTGSGSLNIRAK